MKLILKSVVITLGFLTGFSIVSCSLFRASSPDGRMAGAAPEPEIDCESSKEVITTYNFLLSTKDIEVSREQAIPIAADVAKGCKGAAKRFIATVLLLSKARLAANSIVKIATEVAHGSADAGDAFALIFRLSYLKSGLDLDALSALKLATSLSTEYPGSPKQAEKDFSRIVEFCLSTTGLALSRPQCAALSTRIASFGLNSPAGVGAEYVEVIEKLTAKDGANFTTGDARLIAEGLLEVYPFAAKNFLETYRFAASESGLQMNRKDAVNFAKSIAIYKMKKAEVKDQASSQPVTSTPSASGVKK
jgi:hypothetical protein